MTRGANAVPAAQMSAKERRQEICHLLGVGLLRLRARQCDNAETVAATCIFPTTQPRRTER